MEAGLGQRSRGRVLQHIGQARGIGRRRQQRHRRRRQRLIDRHGDGVRDERGIADGFEVRRTEGLRTLGPIQVIGTRGSRGGVRDDEADLLVLTADPPTEIALRTVGGRRGGLAVHEGDGRRVNLPDGERIGRRTDEGNRPGVRDDRGRRGWLDGRPIGQREGGVAIPHLVGEHPAQEARRGSSARIESLQLRGVIGLLRTSGITAIRPDVVVVALPAAPNAEHGVLEGIRARIGDRGKSGIVVEGGRGGDTRVGTEAFLQGSARQADGAHRVQASHGFGLLRHRQRGLHLQERGEHDDDHHHHGHDNHG